MFGLNEKANTFSLNTLSKQVFITFYALKFVK